MKDDITVRYAFLRQALDKLRLSMTGDSAILIYLKKTILAGYGHARHGVLAVGSGRDAFRTATGYDKGRP